MNLTLDIWSILLIISIAHGLFVLSLILMKANWYRPPTLLLAGLVMAFIWLQAEFLSVRFPFDVGFNLFYGTRHGSWMLLGPLYFLYLKTTLRSVQELKHKDLLHFLPFFIFGIIVPLLSEGLLSWRQVHYGMLTPFDSFEQEVTLLNRLYGLIFILQFIHLAFYLLAGEKLIRIYQSRFLDTNSSFRNGIRWLRGLNLAMLGVLFFITFFLIIFFFTDIYRRHLDYLYVIPLATIIYIIAYRLTRLSVPDVSLATSAADKKYEKSSLTEDQAERYAQKIRQYLTKQKPYLQNDLRLNDLAQSLDIPSYHLSQVINGKMKITFFDLINRQRIAEAQRLIRSQPDASLLQIAYEAGFNNKTSFINAFKKYTGKTPSAYRQQSVLQR